MSPFLLFSLSHLVSRSAILAHPLRPVWKEPVPIILPPCLPFRPLARFPSCAALPAHRFSCVERRDSLSLGATQRRAPKAPSRALGTREGYDRCPAEFGSRAEGHCVLESPCLQHTVL